LALKNKDKTKFDPKPFLHFKEIIIWGGNNFADQLPASRGWLVWDKLREKKPSCFGGCELAWTNINMPIRIWRQLWRGIVREGEENLANGSKLHPCQKPASLMRWCIQFCKGQMVLDPFMGSGTTLRAAKDLGRHAIGIDTEEKYCEISAKRMSQENIQFSDKL
jgi:DNA modification methylase